MNAITPEVMAVAEAQARKDLDLLARLRRTGLVRRDESPFGRAYTRRHRNFVAEVEGRAFPRPNLAIRPKKRRRAK